MIDVSKTEVCEICLCDIKSTLTQLWLHLWFPLVYYALVHLAFFVE